MKPYYPDVVAKIASQTNSTCLWEQILTTSSSSDIKALYLVRAEEDFVCGECSDAILQGCIYTAIYKKDYNENLYTYCQACMKPDSRVFRQARRALSKINCSKEQPCYIKHITAELK